jgi:hypothetical protein
LPPAVTARATPAPPAATSTAMTAINVVDGPLRTPAGTPAGAPDAAGGSRWVASALKRSAGAAGAADAAGVNAVPQPRQNLLSAGLTCWHRSHVTPSEGAGTAEPQARQNLAPALSGARQ